MSLLAGLSQQGDSIAAHNGDAAAHDSRFLVNAFDRSKIGNFTDTKGTDVTAAWSGSATLATALTITNTCTFAKPVGGRWYTNYLGLNISAYTYDSGANVLSFANGAGLEFLTDAPAVELRLSFGGAGTRLLRVMIDGVSQCLTSDATTGTRYVVLTHSGGRKLRRWFISTSGASIVWVELRRDANSIIRTSDRSGSILFIGDSVVRGYNVADNDFTLSYSQVLGRILNCPVVSAAWEGSGYTTKASASHTTYSERWTRDIAGNYSGVRAIFIQSSKNDNGSAVGTVVAAALSFWQTVRAAYPHLPVVVLSPVGDPATASTNTLSAALKTQFDTWADSNSLWIDARELFTTTNVATWLPDNVHPVEAGHLYLAGVVARKFATAFMGL